MQPLERREGEGARWLYRAPWYRRPWRRHLSLAVIAVLLLAIAALLVFPPSAVHNPHPRPTRLSDSIGFAPTILVLLLAGVGARVVFRRILDAVVALFLVVLLFRLWPQVVQLLESLFLLLGSL